MRDYHDPSSRDDDLFEADDLRQRQEKRAAAKEAVAAMAAAEVKQAAALKVRIDARASETNRRQVIAEYQAAGISPPLIDGNGKPTVSLSMLLRLGWKVEDISGKPVLIHPPGYRPPRPIPEPIFGAPPPQDDSTEGENYDRE